MPKMKVGLRSAIAGKTSGRRSAGCSVSFCAFQKQPWHTGKGSRGHTRRQQGICPCLHQITRTLWKTGMPSRSMSYCAPPKPLFPCHNVEFKSRRIHGRRIGRPPSGKNRCRKKRREDRNQGVKPLEPKDERYKRGSETRERDAACSGPRRSIRN